MADVKLSKSLSWLLRHGAVKEGMKISTDGYVDVDEVLNYKTLRKYTVTDVERAVENNDKQRFTLRSSPATGNLQIRANQGHSFKVPELELTPISSPEEVPLVVHGTYGRHWNSIRNEGLKRMNRTHIHFAPGEPGKEGVISGMRSTCQICIYIDIEKAMKDGLQFFRSANNVILCSGNKNGVVDPKYFKKVVERSSGKVIMRSTED